MGATRDPWVYSNQEHPFDRMTLDSVQQVGATGLAGRLRHFDHFITLDAQAEPAAEGVIGAYTLSGAVGTATLVRQAGTGRVRLTTTATSGHNAHLELTNLSRNYTKGKAMWVFARMAIQVVATQIVYFGLGTPGTTDWNAALPSDGIFLHKAVAATNFDLQVRKDGTSTTVSNIFSGLTLADDTFLTVGFQVPTAGGVQPFFNLTSDKFTKGTGANNDDANLPSGAADLMTLQAFTQTGAAATRYLDLDWWTFEADA